MDRATELRHWKECQLVSKTRSELDEFREPLRGCSFILNENDLSDENQLMNEDERMNEDIEGIQYDCIFET